MTKAKAAVFASSLVIIMRLQAVAVGLVAGR
jgi:hypothetical protein